MNYFHKVDMLTGQIKCTGKTTAKNIEAQAAENEIVFFGDANRETQYYMDGILTDRPIMLVTVTAELLQGVVDGAALTIRKGIEFEVDIIADGSDIALTFDDPGLYQYQIELFPYQLVKGEINAA